MLLALNANNTRVKIAAYDGERLAAFAAIATARCRDEATFGALVSPLLRGAGLDPAAFDAVAVASVVPMYNEVFAGLARRRFGVEALFVDATTDTGVRVACDWPEEVGADRICNAVAAFGRFAGPAIVVDLGTAVCLTVVSADGELVGGAIAPGPGIALDALTARASLLRGTRLSTPPRVLARNNSDALQSGTVYGYASLIEGLVVRTRAELGTPAPVVATGGFTELLAPVCRCFDDADPNLTLDGLRRISDRFRARRPSPS